MTICVFRHDGAEVLKVVPLLHLPAKVYWIDFYFSIFVMIHHMHVLQENLLFLVMLVTGPSSLLEHEDACSL